MTNPLPSRDSTVTSPVSGQPLHLVALKLREAIDKILPDGVGVVITTTEGDEASQLRAVASGDLANKIVVTIVTWPKDFVMNNRERVVAVRQAQAAGGVLPVAVLQRYAYLSLEGLHLMDTIQSLIDTYCPSRVSPDGHEVWDVNGYVAIDQGAMARERVEIVQSLKAKKTP